MNHEKEKKKKERAKKAPTLSSGGTQNLFLSGFVSFSALWRYCKPRKTWRVFHYGCAPCLRCNRVRTISEQCLVCDLCLFGSTKVTCVSAPTKPAHGFWSYLASPGCCECTQRSLSSPNPSVRLDEGVQRYLGMHLFSEEAGLFFSMFWGPSAPWHFLNILKILGCSCHYFCEGKKVPKYLCSSGTWEPNLSCSICQPCSCFWLKNNQEKRNC